ncbi:histamine H2 receptor-like [Stylophora pistillata]|uniref:histamine H2 receptor-like n=1 Tax=Stylophora pistillata TaxID=50429 RepID=UPI000C0527F9|nr:histamine H2 receptor-like [Stylophora pistillata]
MNRTYSNCFFLDINLEKNAETLIASILTCVFNAVFSLITSTGNCIILRVIWKTQELHLPPFMLLLCLSASDLLVGLICQPFYVAYQIAELSDNFRYYCILRMAQNISGWTTAGVSVLILSCISVDRLLALTLHLRYRTSVTICRVLLVACFLWTGCITGVLLKVWIRNWIIIPLVVLLISFLVTAASTFQIFRIVRKHQRQIKQQQRSVQMNTVNVLKCRKSAVTVLYVYGLFLFFYVPFFSTMFAEALVGYSLKVKIAYDYTTTAVFINSSLNPFLYCWRIKEIRHAVKTALKRYSGKY